jgi:glycosyltransferase involved in cell wall biosynthesis
VYEDKSVAVVVPAYNEEGFVGEVIETVPEYVDTTFVIDDRSTDGTWEEITTHAQAAGGAVARARRDGGESTMTTDGSGAQLQTGHADDGTTQAEEGVESGDVDAERVLDGDVVPVRNPENSGRGYAVKTGYRLALLAGHDVVAVMDGDGQMDPAVLTDLLDPVVAGNADYAKGNRLVSLAHCEGMSNWRLFGNVVLTTLTKLASGRYELRDPQNGYTAISAQAASSVSLDEVYDGYGFLNDLLIRLAEREHRIVDVPMRAVYRDEESGIRYKTFVPNLSLLLLRGLLRRLRHQYWPSGRTRADTEKAPGRETAGTTDEDVG